MSPSPPVYASAPGQQKAVSVFCGSSPGKKPIFALAAQSLGHAMAQSNIPLIYGGGRRGTMGVVAQSALEAGGYVHGLLPTALVKRMKEDTAHKIPNASVGTSSEPIQSGEGQGVDVMDTDANPKLSLELVETMHERLLRFAKLSQGGFICLPGGYGTLEEMFEMVTWTQLGIHRLPVVAVNVNNYYTPIRAMMEQGVEAGFIYPENLSLLQIVDLDPSDPSGNCDESRAAEWGPAIIKALNNFRFAQGSGYGFTWEEKKAGGVVSSEAKAPLDAHTGFSLFSTARYTSPRANQPTVPVTREAVPLLEYHLERLRSAHAHFLQRDGSALWGDWIGNDALWDILRQAIEGQETTKTGDWRVRILIHPGCRPEVQLIPAPGDIAPFAQFPAPLRQTKRKKLVLDPVAYHDHEENDKDRSFRLFKTTQRAVYDEAGRRGDVATGNGHTEVVLHTDTHLLETNISNIALQIPSASGELEWITPRLDRTRLPFLRGVMRSYLLDGKIIREGDVTLDDWARCSRAGLRVIAFNGLRGVVEVEAVT